MIAIIEGVADDGIDDFDLDWIWFAARIELECAAELMFTHFWPHKNFGFQVLAITTILAIMAIQRTI